MSVLSEEIRATIVALLEEGALVTRAEVMRRAASISYWQQDAEAAWAQALDDLGLTPD